MLEGSACWAFPSIVMDTWPAAISNAVEPTKATLDSSLPGLLALPVQPKP